MSVPAPSDLLEQLKKEIPKETRDTLDAGSNHPFTCTCDTCLEWWCHVGPEGGEPGQYGPFTKEQVNERQLKLGLPRTP